METMAREWGRKLGKGQELTVNVLSTKLGNWKLIPLKLLEARAEHAPYSYPIQGARKLEYSYTDSHQSLVKG